MKKFFRKKIILPTLIALIAIGAVFAAVKIYPPHRQTAASFSQPVQHQSSDIAPNKASATKIQSHPPIISFVGPRQNLPINAPADYGLWSFAIPVPGVLSRSGQPLLSGFQWMKAHGWKGDVDLRIDNDHGEQADDAKIPGFDKLGLHYLHLQIIDGQPPTDKQAQEFLKFMTDPANLPADVHCRGGIGRAGTMVALYRYAVQGWPMDQALAESKLFQGGVSVGQKAWLLEWSSRHAPGSYK